MRTKVVAAALVAAIGCGGAPLACAADAGTTVGGTLFFDFSYIRLQNEDATGTKVDAPPSGWGLDVKRFYLIVNHRFDDMWAANITTDAQYSSSTGNTSVIIKKLYLEGAFCPAFVLHVGAYDNPWVPFLDGQYGYRYIEKSITDRLGFANSADWGINANGKFANGRFGYSASVVNGGGYKNPTTRTKDVDFEGRVSAQPIDWLMLGAGFYAGHLGQITAANQDFPSNTATRWDAMIAVKFSGLRVGAEYFDAKNYKTVDAVATAAYGTSAVVASSAAGSVPSDRADGVSAWASFSFNPQWSVFARYDDAKLSKDVAPNLKDQYANAGVAYKPVKPLDVALVYKYEKVNNGSTSVSAGNANNSFRIGGATGTTSGTYDEGGIYLQYKF
jgi:hypothetical protein